MSLTSVTKQLPCTHFTKLYSYTQSQFLLSIQCQYRANTEPIQCQYIIETVSCWRSAVKLHVLNRTFKPELPSLLWWAKQANNHVGIQCYTTLSIANQKCSSPTPFAPLSKSAPYQLVCCILKQFSKAMCMSLNILNKNIKRSPYSRSGKVCDGTMVEYDVCSIIS